MIYILFRFAALIPLGWAAVTDIRSREIPLWATISILFLAAVQYAIGIRSLQMLLGGAAFGLIVFFAAVLSKPGSIGGGDIKLLVVLSVFCGLAESIILIAIAAVITLLLWLILRKTRLPFAPGIGIAYIVTTLLTLL